MKTLLLATTLALSVVTPVAAKTRATKVAAQEVTLKGTLGCGKCSFHEAKACENVLKVKVGDQGTKEESYLLADNAVSRANHEKVCGPASPATVTGSVSEEHGRKILTASAITFE
ncbi:MAG TPA: DUF6370 family protein [Polyangia bacterium]|nr:DUF6370 family protein [Polyangia bacterium]